MAFLRGAFCASAVAVICAFIGQAVAATKEPTKSNSAKAEANHLVAEAVKAEVAGDTSARYGLLHDAIRIDPDNALAHWHLGEVRLGDQWVSIEESQRRAASDPRQTEYRQVRKSEGDTPQAQLAVARWCRKNNLTEEAQFHWASVLWANPKNEEALRALDLRWQKGRIVARGQAEQAQEQKREASRAAARWAPKIVKWRRDATSADITARLAALKEIRAIAEADSIPSMEKVSLGSDKSSSRPSDEREAIGIAYVDALGKMHGQAATQSLVRHAVLPAGEKVRRAATEKLKSRDQHDYVPMLLDGLRMPFESSYSLNTTSNGDVFYSHSLYLEGQEKDVTVAARNSSVQNDWSGRGVEYDMASDTVTIGLPTSSRPEEVARRTAVTAVSQQAYVDVAAQTESRVAEANKLIAARNARIVPVLEKTTGKDFGDNAKAWWDWWRSYNEYYKFGEHPVEQNYAYNTESYDYGMPRYDVRFPAPPPPPPPPPGGSCFANGTLVWTKTGLVPIETIEPGDLVLSQDVNSGEIKYAAVMQTTLRPPIELYRISFAQEELRATSGHPFWIAGSGWRMVKEMKGGATLHGISRSSTIRTVRPDGVGEAYNLVVADFNTYFVGEGGVLSHDVTPRAPTQAIVPGISEAGK
jgi:hypothetical protein